MSKYSQATDPQESTEPSQGTDQQDSTGLSGGTGGQGTPPDKGKNKSGYGSDGCSMIINIESHGDVNIYNCPPELPGKQTYPPPGEECPPCPTAAGACVPLALGAKPKQSLESKLQHLLSNVPRNSLSNRQRATGQILFSANSIPSALAASYIQLSRRFLAGKQPANALEQQVFAAFSTLSPDLRGVLSCMVDSFDSLSTGERDGLFLSTLTADINTPIDPNGLGTAVGEEITQRASQLVFGDPQAVEQERPGKNRFFKPEGEFFDVQLRVCRINDLRTNEFSPALQPGDYSPEELEIHCEPVLVNNQVQLNCETQVGSCPGNFLTGDICLRVPDVEAGTAVVLEGVNYISVDAKVRLTSAATGISVDVDAHVVGDVDTPLNEVVNGTTLLIRDCRVHDRLTFLVPADLTPGVYSFQIVMPNVSGIPELGDPILSNPQYLRAVPPATARFQIALDSMHCDDETSPAFFGSDEVGISVVAAPLLPDGTTGSLQVLKNNDGKAFIRFDDVDSDESFTINRVLFSQQQNIIALAMSLNGYEIDSDDAFEKQVTSSMDVFIDIVKKEWDFIKAAITAAGGYEKLAGLGLYGYIALGIAALITLTIDIIIALWAPADPIMHDVLGFSTSELAELTSANLPLPSAEQYAATDDITVKITPLEKIPQQYKERRGYDSDDEGSIYQLFLRYNRLA